MKINNTSMEVVTGGKAADTKAADRSGNRAASSAPTASGSSGSDRVQLSELSTQLAALESSLAAPEVDRARVESIKQAIREGRVQVNSEVVADRMLQSALAMINRGQG